MRALSSTPAQSAARPQAEPGAVAEGRPFGEALFEEGQRAGNPWQSAALDTAPGRGMGDHLAADLDRRGGAPLYGPPEDPVPDTELTWGDALDIINPLHHIPIVANVYRALTGDTISGPARVAGATLYGGPFGMIAGSVNAAMAEANGADLGDTLIAGLLGTELPDADSGVSGGETELADAAGTSAPAAVSSEPSQELAAQSSNQSLTLASGFAPQPEAAGPALSGDAALSALFGDLRAGGKDMTGQDPAAQSGVPAVPVAAVSAQALPDSYVEPLAADGLISGRAPQMAPTQAFSARMMEGLDKYKALAIERGGAGRPALEAQ